MKIDNKLLNELKRVLSNPTPVDNSLRFEHSGNDLCFKILNEKDVFISAVYNGTMNVEFKLTAISNTSPDKIILSGTNCGIIVGLEKDNGMTKTCWVNDRECDLLLATIDLQREDPLITYKDGKRGMEQPYLSPNGEWRLAYYDKLNILVCDKMDFEYDSIIMSKKYIMLYNKKEEDNKIYISRTKVSPF